jgi:hypothetical protein
MAIVKEFWQFYACAKMVVGADLDCAFVDGGADRIDGKLSHCSSDLYSFLTGLFFYNTC